MKHLKNFKIFKEAFEPKRLTGREEEAEKRGLLNLIKKAKKGEFKNFSWIDGDLSHVVFEDIDLKDDRVCVLEYDTEESYILVTLHKQSEDHTKPWILSIEDHKDDHIDVSRERFLTFEDAQIKMEEYFGILPEIQNY